MFFSLETRCNTKNLACKWIILTQIKKFVAKMNFFEQTQTRTKNIQTLRVDRIKEQKTSEEP